MGDPLILAAGPARLELTPDGEGGCRVRLRTGEAEQDLGGESLEVITRRLLVFLEDPDSAPPADPGSGWRWIWSLSAPHSALYGHRAAAGYRFLVEDERAEAVCEFDLGAVDAARWAGRLRGWRAAGP